MYRYRDSAEGGDHSQRELARLGRGGAGGNDRLQGMIINNSTVTHFANMQYSK